MKRSKFSEQQIAYALRQADAGTSVGGVLRQLGVSEATFYAWKKTYAHLGVSEVRRLRQLEDENARLKRLRRSHARQAHALRALAKKSLRPARRREFAQWFQVTFQVSYVRACRLAQFSRAAWYRPSQARDQSALRLRIRDLARAAALRLSAHLGVAAPRRLARESPTGAATLSPRRPAGAHARAPA